MDSAYLKDAAGLAVGDAQREFVRGLRRCIAAIGPAQLDLDATTAELLEDGRLRLELRHRLDTDIYLSISIDPDGRVGMLCPALHPKFELCFNDIWEPYDCLGDLALGIEVTCAILGGRVESELLWSGDELVRSKDILTRLDGSRVVLFSQYHSVVLLLGGILKGQRETRRVTFT